MSKADSVNHPKHYTFGAIEVMDAIEAWALNFARGCIVKYAARAGRKGQNARERKRTEIEDLKKARWYIDREIERLRRGKRADSRSGDERRSD
jgi:hypothetical protein